MDVQQVPERQDMCAVRKNTTGGEKPLVARFSFLPGMKQNGKSKHIDGIGKSEDHYTQQVKIGVAVIELFDASIMLNNFLIAGNIKRSEFSL